MNAQKSISIFISYASEDRDEVKVLYKKLLAEGYQPWMDVENIYPGENWRSAIEKGIRNADFFLFCLSDNSARKRGHVQVELKQSLDIWREKLADDIYLIPVRLTNCKVPDEIKGQFQWVDLFDVGGFDKLLGAIREGLARM